MRLNANPETNASLGRLISSIKKPNRIEEMLKKLFKLGEKEEVDPATVRFQKMRQLENRQSFLT